MGDQIQSAAVERREEGVAILIDFIGYPVEAGGGAIIGLMLFQDDVLLDTAGRELERAWYRRDLVAAFDNARERWRR